jgi:hypothetical protein
MSNNVILFPADPTHTALQIAELKTLDTLAEIGCTYSNTLATTLSEIPQMYLTTTDVLLMDVIEAELLSALDALNARRELEHE